MALITTLLIGLGGFTECQGTVIFDSKPVREAVVWLDGGPKAAPVNAIVDQRGKRFIPHISVVPKGSTVNFPNNDEIFHNIFAEYRAARFDFGMYPKGTSKKQTFKEPGLVALLCNVHAEMSAYIYVVDTAYYTITDGSGRFKLDNVKPGRYTLNVWHESGRKAKEIVTIPMSSTLEVKLHR